jgi:hypothetical protein
MKDRRGIAELAVSLQNLPVKAIEEITVNAELRNLQALPRVIREWSEHLGDLTSEHLVNLTSERSEKRRISL